MHLSVRFSQQLALPRHTRDSSSTWLVLTFGALLWRDGGASHASDCDRREHCRIAPGGLDALRFFFPGILEDLTAEGSRVSDTAQDVLWFNNGAWRLRSKCGVTGCIQTRPLLELHIRRRIEKLPNVIQLYGVSAKGLEMDATKSRVAGVHIAEDGGAEKILPADLVVDCSGRGSKTPAWLEAAGLGKPPVTVVVVNVGLLDRVFSRSRKESSGLACHADLGEGEFSPCGIRSRTCNGHCRRSLLLQSQHA